MKKVKTQLALPALAALLLSGCSMDDPVTDKRAAAVTSPPRVLDGTIWQVEDIDRGGIIDRSMVTMEFKEGSRILGFTGCNRYFGDATVAGDVVSFGGIGSTRRACAPALMHQEQQFLDALNESARFAMDTDAWLVLYDAQGVARVRAIEVDSDPTAVRPQRQDVGSDAPIVFDCAGGGAISFRFVGPETIELSAGEDKRVLTREPSASGARYSGEEFEFWNKGDEAILTIGEEQYTCQRRLDSGP